MTEKDLSQIENRLKITLPNEYRALMLARAAELMEAGCFGDDLSAFYLHPKQVVQANKLERPKESGTGYAFPRWWETFFLVGTNGGGDYYCLRLDNKPGVWMIGSDCGDKPTRVARSLKAFVDKRVKERKTEQDQAARRQEVIHEETRAEEQALAGAGDGKAKEWLGAQTPHRMFDLLDNLGRKLSPRKLRLFGIACCRRIVDLMMDDDCRRAVHLAERLVAGEASPEETGSLRDRMKKKYLVVRGEDRARVSLWCVGAAKNLLQDDEGYLRTEPIYAGDADLLRVWNSAFSATSGDGAEHRAQADLLREVVGNPFHPARFEPGRQSAAVVVLARTMYDTQDFDQMPALADALADAGCDDQRILKHCRRKGGHVRGCWIVDAALGLSDPEPRAEEFAWDFQWEHPAVDGGKLTQRLRASWDRCVG